MLLATVLFAAILAINRVFVAEREQGGFDAIRLAPVDGTSLFAAKARCWSSTWPRSSWSRCPCSRSSSSTTPAGCWRSPACWLLADLGLAAIGALVSSIAVNSRARDLIAPLLLLPLLVPVMIAAAGAAEPLLAAGGPVVRRLRQVDRGARSLRCGVLPRRLRGLRLRARGLTAPHDLR